MAGTVQYLFEILYQGINTPNGWVYSLAPVKTAVAFAYGTFTQESGQTDVDKGYCILPAGPMLTSIDNSVPATPVLHTVTLTGPTISGADALLKIPPRPKVETWDCWVFTNSAGDVIASPRCKDVLDFNAYVTPPGQFRAPSPLVPSDSTRLPRPFEWLFVGGAGNVNLVLPLTNPDGSLNAESTQLIGPVTAGTLLKVSGIGVNLASTTATSLFYW